MSDTDDTDALLNCDPGGGLQSLLETAKTGGKMESTGSFGGSSQSVDRESSNKDTSLDVSDFFNSAGELVLPRLSQLCESSDSDTAPGDWDLANMHDASASVSVLDGDDNSSDDGTTCSVESDTVVKQHSDKRHESKVEEVQGNGDTGKVSNIVAATTAHSSTTSQWDDAVDVPEEVQRELRHQLVQANRRNPGVQDWLESESSHLNYGVLNLNLNDLKTFAEGISRHNLFPKVSTFVPTTNADGEQIFTRAPNFRTPGGYKPPKHPKKCRDLTEDQIREEVRKMYAFPDADDDDDGDGSSSNNKTDENRSTEKDSSDRCETTESGSSEKIEKSPENVEKVSNSKIEFDFLHGTPVPSEFGKGKSGKPVKRKLLPNAGRICGGTVGSIPDLGFGIRQKGPEDGVDVEEPPIVKSTAWTVGNVNDRNIQPSGAVKDKSSLGGFSFGYGEEENLLSPIRPSSTAELAHQVNTNLLQSERIQRSPEKPDNSTKAVNWKFDSTELPPLDVETKENGHRCSSSSSSSPSNQVQKPKTTSSKRRVIRKAATKNRGMPSSPRRTQDSTSSEEAFPVGSIASDLQKILNEVELPAEELESLINNLDDDSNGNEGRGLGAAKFFEDIGMEEGSFADAFAQLKLEGLNLDNEDSISEKYHTEKYKREHCEKELRSVHENLLVEKQQNAVLEGTLKRRNMMLIQISMTFNRVCEEWKKFDSINRTAVTKLQDDQKVLAATCKQSRERISQYEKELHKTLELADSFKSKLIDVQRERDDTVSVLKSENNELEGKMATLMEEMDSLKNERDATLRALRESQIKLDDGTQSLKKMEVKLQALEEKDIESTLKYEDLQLAKSHLDSSYAELVTQRKELEMLVTSLKNELSIEKSSKVQLKRDMQDETKRTTRAEAERLHEYYNKKVQEILKSATEEAAKAESVLKGQMKRASHESERKLVECKEKFHQELDSLKSRYEGELDKLKKENLHRQLLISSTVKQLQMGDSPNLDFNPLSVTGRTPYQKESFDNIVGSHEGSGSSYKPGGFPQVTKFTLDHLNLAAPSSKKSRSTEEIKKHNGGFGDGPFEMGSSSERFKTSTPIDPHAIPPALLPAELVGTGFKLLGPNFEDKLKVRTDKAASSIPGSSDCKLVFSRLLEAPVRPEKEQRLMSNIDLNGKPPEAPLDPALQKCIQELIKSYAEKVNPNPDDKSVSNCTAFAHKSSSSSSQDNACNGNDVDISNNNGEDEIVQSSSGFDSQTGDTFESHKDKPNSQLKPPWK